MGLKVYTGESNGYSPGAYYQSSAPATVDINSEESLKKWEEVLHLSRKELLQAVENFGPLIRNIRRGLLESADEAA